MHVNQFAFQKSARMLCIMFILAMIRCSWT